MRLLRLTVNNFGVFHGIHQFDLSPTEVDGEHRTLTLFTGHNGAGKSTLFRAMSLALQGLATLGDRVTRREYETYLLGRTHRHSHSGLEVFSLDGHVALLFEYVESGQPLEIEVERRWSRRNGTGLQETLLVCRNGQRPDVDPEQYQSWVSELIPPGLLPICFFDAETLDSLGGPNRHNPVLADTLQRLLGLDLVERLEKDLGYYLRGQGGSQRIDTLREEVHQNQAALQILVDEMEQAKIDAASLATQAAQLEMELVREEHRLVAEGGVYAAQRPTMQARLSQVKEEMERTTAQLRELTAGLLPFALVPELCQALSQRLTQEAQLHRKKAASDAWQERADEVAASLSDEELWQGFDVPDELRRALVERLIKRVREESVPYVTEQQAPIHHLSDLEQDQLQGWILEVLNTLPRQVESFGESLRALRVEQTELEERLRRAPDEATLAPIHNEIARLQTELATIRGEQAALDKQIRLMQFRLDEQARRLQRAADALEQAQVNERQLGLAERSRTALRAYQDALTRQRVEALEEELVIAFNRVCRKEHLLAGATICPNDFTIQLKNSDGHVLDLQDFSAGERQLYALALLWALRRVSGRRLPLAIDTPLGRLDATHQSRLLDIYFPEVSDQVLLFATDAEVDVALLAQLEPLLARVYSLRYDPSRAETEATELSGHAYVATRRSSDAHTGSAL